MKCILIIGKKKTKKKNEIKQKNEKKKKNSSISNVAHVQRYQWRFHW
jgi:hypothetical protein